MPNEMAGRCHYVMSDLRYCREDSINPDCPLKMQRCLDHKDAGRPYRPCETPHCDWTYNDDSGFCRFCNDVNRKKLANQLRADLKKEQVCADVCLNYLQDRRSLSSRRVQRALEKEFGDELYLDG